MNIFEVGFWIEDYLVKTIYRICLYECLWDHVVQALTRLVQINLPEKFKSSFVYHVNFIIDLLVVGNLTIDYASIVNDSAVVYFWLVNTRMDQVPVEVVKLVQIKWVTLVCYDIKKEKLIRVLLLVSCAVTLDEILNEPDIILCQAYLVHLVPKLIVSVINQHYWRILVLPWDLRWITLSGHWVRH